MKQTQLIMGYGETYYKLLLGNGFKFIRINFSRLTNEGELIKFTEKYGGKLYLTFEDKPTKNSRIDYNKFLYNYKEHIFLVKDVFNELEEEEIVITTLKGNKRYKNIEINPVDYEEDRLLEIIEDLRDYSLHLTSYRRAIARQFDSVTSIDWIHSLKYKNIFVLKDGEMTYYKSNNNKLWDMQEVKDVCNENNIDYNKLYEADNESILKYTFAVFKNLEISLQQTTEIIPTNLVNSIVINLCNNCSYQSKCSYYKKDGECEFKLPIVEINDGESFGKALLNMLNIQQQRIMKGLMRENLSGGNKLDEQLSKEMNTFISMSKEVKKMSEDKNMILIKGKEATEAVGQSLLANFFGGVKKNEGFDSNNLS